jgi:nicotinamide-nucleotide amidase
MDVEIITIGDELLIGQVVDTNSAWMAKILNDNGFSVIRKVTVGDNADDILKAIDDARRSVSVVLITGGLGPTKDDITLKTLCKYFDCSLRFSDEVYSNIERMFKHNNRVMNDLTRSQAMIPDKAAIIQNAVGTAPCTWFERDGGVLVSMPGVPFEMKWLMENEIVPRLKSKFLSDTIIRHKSFWVAGIPESALSIKLEDFENNMPPYSKLAYLPNSGIIRLRISVCCNNRKLLEETVDSLQKQLETVLAEYLIATGDGNIEELVGELLRSKGLTVGTAESCTGGAIAALLTSVAGSSDYFKGSVVAYSNEVKRNVLCVPSEDIERHGAVSRTVVEQMALGALKVLGCDYAIATSGIAGPGGGTPEKPVGTIWIALAKKGKVISKEYHFTTIREQNITRAAHVALTMLLRECSD